MLRTVGAFCCGLSRASFFRPVGKVSAPNKPPSIPKVPELVGRIVTVSVICSGTWAQKELLSWPPTGKTRWIGTVQHLEEAA